MVLQTRNFNNTKNVNSSNYDSDHNASDHDDVCNPSISSDINELDDSFINEMTEKEDSKKRNLIDDGTIENSAESKTNKDNTKNCKIQNNNNCERENFNTTATKLSNVKMTKRKDHREDTSRISNSEIERKYLKMSNYPKKIKNTFNEPFSESHKYSEENNEKSDIYDSDSRTSLSKTPLPNFSNSEEEIDEAYSNISDFNDEDEENEIIMPSYMDENKDLELEQNEMPHDFHLNKNVQTNQSSDICNSPKRYSRKKTKDDYLSTEIPSVLSEHSNHSNKMVNLESSNTRKKVSEKFKDAQNTDLKHEINEIYCNVRAEVQSIANKTEISGSLSEDDEIAFHFLNGTLDLEKHLLKNCNGSNTDHSDLISKRKQIGKNNTGPTKMVKKKQPVMLKSQPLKEKTPVNSDTKVASKKRTLNATGHNNKSNQSAKKKLALQVGRNKNDKETDHLPQTSFRYRRSSFDNSFNNIEKEHFQNENPIGETLFQNGGLEDSSNSQDNYFSNSKTRNIQACEKNLSISRKNNTKKTSNLETNTNVSTRESCKDNNNEEICVSSKRGANSAKNKMKVDETKNITNKNLQTWEDLESALLKNDTHIDENQTTSTDETEILPKENFQMRKNIATSLNKIQFDKNKMSLREAQNIVQVNSKNKKFESQSSDDNLVQSVSDGKPNNTLDVIRNTRSRYSFNKHQSKKLMYSEKSLAIEKPMPLVVKSSPNMSIIEKAITKMNNCASPYLKPRMEACQFEITESSKSDEDNSPILTDYSYAIQEFESTIYFTADNGTTQETCFASKRAEKERLHENEVHFSKQNYKHCIQNKSLSAVINQRKNLPNPPVLPKPIFTRSPTNAPSSKKNKQVTSVTRRKQMMLTPEIKFASDTLAIKSNKNIIFKGEKTMKIYPKRKDLNKKDKINDSDISICTEDSGTSEESTGFNFKGRIDRNKSYNLRKRKLDKDSKGNVDKYEENTRKHKRGSISSDQQSFDRKFQSNLKNEEIWLSSDQASEDEKSCNSSVKQRKHKTNSKLEDNFVLNHGNSEEEEINYSNCYLNESSNLADLKQNDHSHVKKEYIPKEKVSLKGTNKRRVFDKKGNMHEKNEDALICKEVVTPGHKISPKIRNAEKNIESQFLEETKNDNLKSLKGNTSMGSKPKKKQTYDEYRRHLEEVFQNEDSFFQTVENSQYSDPENPATDSDLKQNFQKPLIKVNTNGMAETSDDDVFSISSFDTDSEENEVPQTQGSGGLFFEVFD